MLLTILCASTLCILPFATAATCDSSNALVWSGDSSDDFSPGGSSVSSSDDPCVQECGNDSACLQACYEVAQIGQCNAVGCTDSDDDDVDLIGDGSSGDPSDLIKRDTDTTLECTSSETCYLYPNGVPFCLDTGSGDFVDRYGGTGNMDSNVYTMPDGQVTTVPSAGAGAGSGATRSATATSDQTTAQTTAQTTGTGTESSITSSTASAESAPSPTATSTGAARLNMEVSHAGSGVVVGALGLVMGLFDWVAWS